jgi:hypothetical protein
MKASDSRVRAEDQIVSWFPLLSLLWFGTGVFFCWGGMGLWMKLDYEVMSDWMIDVFVSLMLWGLLGIGFACTLIMVF